MRTARANTDRRGAAAKIAAGAIAVTSFAACSPAGTTTDRTTESASAATNGACAEFNSLTLSGQISAVRNEQTPTDPSCEPAVANATVAAQTADDAADLWEQIIEGPGLYTGSVKCNDADAEWTISWESNSANPIAFFGFYYLTENDEVTAIRPMWDINVRAGVTTSFVAIAPAPDRCGLSAVPTLWSEPFVPLDPPAPVSDDDPQAADDPSVWFPALQEQLNEGRETGSADYLTDNVYDLRAYAALTTTKGEPIGASRLTYCSTLDVSPPPGLEDGWAVLLLTGEAASDDRAGLHLGFFARGNDQRWRIVSISNTVKYPYDQSDPCAAPPLM